MYNFDAKKTKNDIVKWMKEWAKDNAQDCQFIVGISGGKDSSVVAALCVEAFGRDRVVGVLMPQGNQKDINYSKMLCEHLGIENYTINIFEACRTIKHEVKNALYDHWSLQSSINLPARVRMATLYAVAQTLNGRVANTCNLTETLLSFETRWGDSVGDFAPISDLTVQEVKAVGYELGLPKELIEKVPCDGLCGKTDEEALGLQYSVVDRYIRTGEIDDIDTKNKIDEKVKKYRFKREPIPYFNTGLKRFVD